MSLFDHEARQFKFDVLREVSKRAFDGKLNDDVCDEVANLLIPGKHAEFRCCIYKEREIIRQRVRLAEGKSYASGREWRLVSRRYRWRMITSVRLYA